MSSGGESGELSKNLPRFIRSSYPDTSDTFRERFPGDKTSVEDGSLEADLAIESGADDVDIAICSAVKGGLHENAFKLKSVSAKVGAEDNALPIALESLNQY